MKLLLCLIPALALAGPRLKVIVSHDDLLGALTCYSQGYRYFKRLSKDDILCADTLQGVTPDNRRGMKEAKGYIRAQVIARGVKLKN